MSQSQQPTQATGDLEEKIRMSINLLYIEGTSEKLWCILKSHKIRSTFYTEMFLHKLLWKPKDCIATEYKSDIDYEIDCSNCQAVYFGESKWLLKSRSDEHIRMELLNTAGKQIATLTGIRRKLLIGKAG